MRTRSHPWLAMLLVLSGCEPGGVAVPPGLDTPQALARGRALFLDHCAICHVENADGQGPRRPSLSPAPANFRDPSWRERSSPGQTFRKIRDGVPGTPMAGWKPVLSETQTWEIVAWLHAAGGGSPERGP